MSDLLFNLSIDVSSNYTRSDWEYYPLWFHLFLWLVMFVLSTETIVGNLMVVLAYKLDRQIRKHLSNKFIVSLAISDLIIGLEGFPLLTVYVVQGQRWPLGHVICQIWLFLDYTLCLVSILTVLLITVDRYGSVCYPALYIKWQSEKKTHWMIGFSWIIPALFFSIMIFGWTAFTGEAVSDPTQCYAPFLNDPYVNMSMYIVYYWTTLVAMLILYRGIHKTAKSLEKRGEQREKQSLALLMGQMRMAQVGVGLLMRSQAQTECQPAHSEEDAAATLGITVAAVDSGYGTGAAPTQTTVEQRKSPSPLKQQQKRAPLLLSQLNQTSIGSLDPYDNVSLMSGFGDFSTSSVLALKFDPNPVPPRTHKKLSYRDLFLRNSSYKSIRSSHSERRNNSAPKKKSNSQKPHLRSKSRSLLAFSKEELNTAAIITSELEKISSLSKQESFTEARSKSCHQRKTSTKSSSSSDSSSDEHEVVQHIKRQATLRQKMNVWRREKNFAACEEFQEKTEKHGASALETLLVVEPDTSERDSKSKAQRDSTPSIAPPTFRPRRPALAAIFNPVWLQTRRRKKTGAEKRARKAFRTITFIVGFFMLFWSPYYIVATVYGFCPDCIPSPVFLISYYMCYLNSSLNPFAYALANRQFRIAFRRFWRRDFSFR